MDKWLKFYAPYFCKSEDLNRFVKRCEALNGQVDVVVNGVKITSLNSYKTKIWNSGDQPLKKIPIRFVFDTKDSNCKIFRTTHKTKPRYEFGKITEEGSDSFSKRFIYDLLNSNDSDLVTFLTNSDPRLELYAKLKGLKINRVEEGQTLSFTDYLKKGAIYLAMFGAVLLKILRAFQEILSEEIKTKFKAWFESRKDKKSE